MPSSTVCANPRSIVIPRAFSSCRRSGFRPRQRKYERALAVIDVPSGADDDVLHPFFVVPRAIYTPGPPAGLVFCDLAHKFIHHRQPR